MNAGKLIPPNVTIKVGAEVVNHLPVMTDFNAGAAEAFDECPNKPIEPAKFKKIALIIPEPMDTVGTAKGVSKGEGPGNKPPVNTC